MADVEISYNGDTIVSMSDSGTEYLDTKGKFMADDVTITYTKSGGGGGSTQVTIGNVGISTVHYVDESGEYQSVEGGMIFNQTVLAKSLICVIGDDGNAAALSNCSLIQTYNLGSRASYRYCYIFQVN